MKKVLMFLAVLPVMASAQISEDSASLPLVENQSQAINLNTGSISSAAPNSCLFYACTTQGISSDLISYFNFLTACACPCVGEGAFGATHTFYISKQNFSSMNHKSLLNLNDTSNFSKIDTIKKGICYAPNNDSVCLLPYIEIGINDSERVIVIETSQQKYAMVRVTPRSTTIVNRECGDPVDSLYTFLGSFSLHWYIQNNGSLDFSGVDQSAVLPHNANPILRVASQNQRYRVGLASSITNRQISEVYTLEGKRIDAGALKKMNELVIYR